MSALPKEVQKQVDKANAIIEDMNKTPEERAAAVAAANLTPPVPAPVAENTPPSSAPPAENTPPEPAAAPAAEPPAPVAEPTAEPDPDHKYKVLQGKYNAEVPRLQRQLKDSITANDELRQRVNNTESMLAAMQTKAAKPPAPTEPAIPVVAPAGITEEERVQFGPDLIDVIERVAEAKLQPGVTAARLDAVDQRFQKVEQNASHIEQSVAVSDRDKTLDALEAAVPDWEKQNENEDFLQWLNANDAYAGVPRGRLLTEAFQSHDAVRVIAIFKGFQTENAVVNPSEPTPVVIPPEPQAKLDDYVAPGTPKTGTTSAPNESGKRVWTRADIARFYSSKNEFSKKRIPIPDEYVKLEKDLIAAQSEGRLR